MKNSNPTQDEAEAPWSTHLGDEICDEQEFAAFWDEVNEFSDADNGEWGVDSEEDARSTKTLVSDELDEIQFNHRELQSHYSKLRVDHD